MEKITEISKEVVISLYKDLDDKWDDLDAIITDSEIAKGKIEIEMQIMEKRFSFLEDI